MVEMLWLLTMATAIIKLAQPITRTVARPGKLCSCSRSLLLEYNRPCKPKLFGTSAESSGIATEVMDAKEGAETRVLLLARNQAPTAREFE